MLAHRVHKFVTLRRPQNDSSRAANLGRATTVCNRYVTKRLTLPHRPGCCTNRALQQQYWYWLLLYLACRYARQNARSQFHSRRLLSFVMIHGRMTGARTYIYIYVYPQPGVRGRSVYQVRGTQQVASTSLFFGLYCAHHTYSHYIIGLGVPRETTNPLHMHRG